MTKKNSSKDEKIVVKGARTHNLKNIDVEMPRNKMIAITGLSGSGKSSLAFDTIFAEGQRRYIESLSAYARQFLRQMPKPDVDEIQGLSPAISIDQKSRSNNPRSTVATITEIYDYLRVLYARIGKPYCLECGREIKKLAPEEIIKLIKKKIKDLDKKKNERTVAGVSFNDNKVQIFAPVVRSRKGEYYQMLYDMLGKGFAQARIDGNMHNLREQIKLTKTKKHNIDILVDEIAVHEFKDDPKGAGERLAEAVELALTEAEEMVRVVFEGVSSSPQTRGPSAAGTGAEATRRRGADKKTAKDQHLPPTPSSSEEGEPHEFLLSANFICPHDGFSYPEIEPRLFSFNSPAGACPECNGLGTKHLFGNENDDACEVCQGARLRPEALHVMLGGPPKDTPQSRSAKRRSTAPLGRGAGLNIVQVTDLSIQEAKDFFDSLKLTEKERDIIKVVLKEITSRLQFMIDVGLAYLSLDRRANTLSGGEAQRIRLASQLGSQLVGALYVLDEPTIGLHQRDNDRLIKTLKELRDLGNTIIVVEHDEDTIYASDYLVDIGPGAGTHGGNVIVADYIDDLLTAKTNKSKSLTLAYLREEEKIPVPEKRRTNKKGSIKVVGAACHNVNNLNVEIPLGKFVVIAGVSGSGKSTFMYEVLNKNLRAKYDRKYRSAKVHNCATFEGDESISRTILIDQSPIGRTPRSNPATYTGAWTHIRDLFAATEEARIRGWKAGRFSFNVKGGRCEACQGNGQIAVEMHFLPTVYVKCDVCNGQRFEKETLKVKYKGKNIHDILHLTVEQALEFFHDIPAIYDRFKTLSDVGLDYLELGQSATTLSGGEAQRVKISSELYRPMTQKTVYLLDEPTVGLHFDDVRKLIEVLNKLIDRGNTVITIEHNLDIIKCADYVMDFGPEGGIGGGKVVAKGTPEDIANNPKSHTGKYLKKVLKRK